MKHKIKLIESEIPTPLWSYKGRKLYFNQANFNDADETIYYDLVVLSGDTIQEDDLIYENNLNTKTSLYIVYKRDDKLGFFRFSNVWVPFSRPNNAKKVIASINKKHNLPPLSNEFVEEWIEAGCREDIEVE